MQPSLLSDISRRARKHGRVTATSVEAYRQVDAKGRSRAVLEMVTDWQASGESGTSAELAGYWATTDEVLYVRRGLSDLLKLGAVEHGPSRTCRISGKTCLTWIVKHR